MHYAYAARLLIYYSQSYTEFQREGWMRWTYRRTETSIIGGDPPHVCSPVQISPSFFFFVTSTAFSGLQPAPTVISVLLFFCRHFIQAHSFNPFSQLFYALRYARPIYPTIHQSVRPSVEPDSNVNHHRGIK